MDMIKRLFGYDGVANRHLTSGSYAKERLQLVLVSDRTGVSPELLQTLKGDLIQVISKYLEIDECALEVSLDSCENQVALVANIPVKKMRKTAQIS